jgi:precorrin-3B synthase
MPTGDGLLVRLMPTEPVPLDAFVGFCEAARQHGNGTIEISARGSLQVRGLTPHSAPLFAAAVAELGIVVHEGVSVIARLDRLSIKSKNTLVNTAHIGAELRQATANARLVLSPKVTVVVDGDGTLHLDALSADIRLRAVGPAQRPRFCVGLDGDGTSATWLGSIAPKDAVGAVLGLLTMIAGHGSTARAAEVLRTKGVEAFRPVLAAFIGPPWAPSRRMPAEMVGLHPARDGTIAVGIGLAFGYAHADALAQIVRIAAIHGAQAVQPAPDRALLLIGVAATNAVHLKAAAERLGFVANADDPRRRIAACPGAPACASGLIPARALASALTPIVESILKPRGNGVAVHISGCHKGCAHPKPTALTLVGIPHGCGIVHDGTAHATPDHYFDPANLGAEISRIAANTSEATHG